MDEIMAKVYVRRIKRGVITIDDVPSKIRDLVQQLLNQQ